MHVLYIHQHFATPDTPAGTRPYELATGLYSRGHQVTVLAGSGTISAQQRIAAESAYPGLRIVRLPAPYRQTMGSMGRFAAFASFAAAATIWGVPRARRFDIIYASSTPLTTTVPARVLSKFGRRPWVLEIRDVWPDTLIAAGLSSRMVITAFRLLAASAYRSARHIVALSGDMANSIRESGDATCEITVIPNGARRHPPITDNHVDDERRFMASLRGVSELTMIYAGTIGRVNHVEYIVEVIAEARDRGHRFDLAIYGTGTNSGSVGDAAETLGVTDRVHFRGTVAKKHVGIMMEEAELGWSTVMSDARLASNSANKVFDYLAHGLPVAVNHEGWLADRLREYEAGVAVPGDDPAAAAETIVSLSADASRLRSMRANAAELFDDEHSWDRLTDQLDHVLTRAMCE
jgi:glycosyltransferase involved in cell wall biosynthesis